MVMSYDTLQTPNETDGGSVLVHPTVTDEALKAKKGEEMVCSFRVCVCVCVCLVFKGFGNSVVVGGPHTS